MSTIATSKDAMAQAKRGWKKPWRIFAKSWAECGRGGRMFRCWTTFVWIITVRRCPINQLGTLNVPDSATIVISPWDPGAVALIDKAIRTTDLGLNPTNDGKVVRVPIPALTEDRRKDMVKHIHKVLENHRTAIRNIRRDIKEGVEKLEKEKKISEDDKKRSLDELEKLTHSETKKIEDLSAAKEKEVLEIK